MTVKGLFSFGKAAYSDAVINLKRPHELVRVAGVTYQGRFYSRRCLKPVCSAKPRTQTLGRRIGLEIGLRKNCLILIAVMYVKLPFASYQTSEMCSLRNLKIVLQVCNRVAMNDLSEMIL